jgi:3,4-dihydroxy 2-butanone 4-phosphate synthase/GTP cyclohydrolase II
LTAVSTDAHPHDLVSPGHVFPLRAVQGGVLQRAGHTEGSLDLARLAGCFPAGVICEVMNDDGTMARRTDLERFAATHQLHICSIADLIQYRLQRERLVRCVGSGQVTLGTGKQWKAYAFAFEGATRDFLALVYGEVDKNPTLLRVHTGNLLGDVFNVTSPGRVSAVEAVRRIEAEGRGVVLFVPGRTSARIDLAIHLGEDVDVLVDRGSVLREFGLGAQVLVELGLGKIRLLTNHQRRIAGLEGYGSRWSSSTSTRTSAGVGPPPRACVLGWCSCSINGTTVCESARTAAVRALARYASRAYRRRRLVRESIVVDGSTSTDTASWCWPPPRITPRIGVTSEKSRPYAT